MIVSGLRSIAMGLVLLGTAAPWPDAARAQTESEADLAELRGQIAAVEARLAEQLDSREDGLAELKRIEVSIGEAGAELARIAGESRAQQARRRALAADAEAARARLAGERAALEEQVVTSYLTGRQELLKLLLSQESPADLGRMLVYYDYLNAARSGRIDAVGNELETIGRLTAESRDAERTLERLEADQARELEALDQAREARQGFLARLDAAIDESGSEIERLRTEEARLTELIEELSTLMARLPGDAEAPFAELRGRLGWPLEGRISADFGDLREGGPLRWNGVVLDAAAGTLVRAVYHGRVAFADWLPGLGLLVILDHGDGYMSLYGYNEVLLHEPGAWVSPGEAIARVGDTGGQETASLYFEIRRDGEPLNPHDWAP